MHSVCGLQARRKYRIGGKSRKKRISSNVLLVAILNKNCHYQFRPIERKHQRNVRYIKKNH